MVANGQGILYSGITMGRIHCWNWIAVRLNKKFGRIVVKNGSQAVGCFRGVPAPSIIVLPWVLQSIAELKLRLPSEPSALSCGTAFSLLSSWAGSWILGIRFPTPCDSESEAMLCSDSPTNGLFEKGWATFRSAKLNARSMWRPSNGSNVWIWVNCFTNNEMD